MKKILPIIIVLLLGALLVWYFGFRDSDKKMLTFSSEELTLEIPATALPEGVSKKDIKISKISPSDILTDPQNPEDLLAFELSPDGLELSEPATVSVAVDGKSVPILYHISADDSEVLNTRVVINEEEGSSTVSGEISHFSHVVSDRSGFFRIIVDPSPVTVNAGESFPVHWLLEPSREVKETYITRLKTVNRYAPHERYQVNMDGEEHVMRTNGKHSPSRVELPPADLMQHEKYEIGTTYTCTEPGEGEIETSYRGFSLAYTLERREFGGDPPDELRRTQELPRTTRIEYRSTPGCIYTGEPEPPPPPEDPPMEFIRLGPQYLIVCTDDENNITATLTGYHAADDAGNPLSDAAGNPIDAETGGSVVCP